jgi:hypothetical protein
MTDKNKKNKTYLETALFLLDLLKKKIYVWGFILTMLYPVYPVFVKGLFFKLGLMVDITELLSELDHKTLKLKELEFRISELEDMADSKKKLLEQVEKPVTPWYRTTLTIGLSITTIILISLFWGVDFSTFFSVPDFSVPDEWIFTDENDDEIVAENQKKTSLSLSEILKRINLENALEAVKRMFGRKQ